MTIQDHIYSDEWKYKNAQPALKCNLWPPCADIRSRECLLLQGTYVGDGRQTPIVTWLFIERGKGEAKCFKPRRDNTLWLSPPAGTSKSKNYKYTQHCCFRPKFLDLCPTAQPVAFFHPCMRSPSPMSSSGLRTS
jgi:hypothetical protein